MKDDDGRVCETAHVVAVNRCYCDDVESPQHRMQLDATLAKMEAPEIQARATIAAALIVSRAVEVPSVPASGDWSNDAAAIRLRALTDYLYQMITCKHPVFDGKLGSD